MRIRRQTLRKMKIPSSVRITAGTRYEVVFVKEFDDKDQYGECRYDSKQIAIRSDLSKTETLKTLCHEILHAIAHEHSFELPHQAVYGLEESLLVLVILNEWV